MKSFLAVGALASAAVNAQSHGTPPESPLGKPEVGLTAQYLKLRDEFGFDTDQYLDFEIEAPKLYLDLARKDLQQSWLQFASGGDPYYQSLCLKNPDNLPEKDWACRCKGMVSALRDAINKFNALFPGAGERYKDDPYYDLEQLIAHDGYSKVGHLCDALKAGGSAGKERGEATYWRDRALGILGHDGDGNNRVFGDPNNPMWKEYAQLMGNIGNDYQALSSKTLFEPRWGDDRDQNLQFWGTNKTLRPYEGFDGYENMGLLFRTQMYNFAGEDDKAWYKCMEYDDLTAKQYGNFYAEIDFHNIRKIPRMMWRTMSDYPLIMPLAFFTTTIACPEPVSSFCINGNFPPLTYPAETWASIKYDGKDVLSQIFLNSEESRGWLETRLGWPPAVVQLAVNMCLGGYHHLDYFSIDASITEKEAEENIDSNAYTFDFVMRMGLIHDYLDKYIHGSRSGHEDPALKESVNTMWGKFKDWLDKNEMLDLLKYKLNPYFPIGNKTATRELAPTLPVSNLPILEIDTHGKSIPCMTFSEVCRTMSSDERSVPATLSVWQFNNRDPPKIYNITIKGHGESSRLWPKKSYGIKFYNQDYTDEEDTKFLKGVNMTSNDEWVLKGIFIDMTLARDHYSLNISRQIGMYAPRTYQSEMYLITDASERSDALHYKGTYLIAESISRGSKRIPVPKNGGPDIAPGAGGYIFTFDKYDEVQDAGRFSEPLPITRNQIILKYPGRTKTTTEQRDWGFEMLARFEIDMYSPNFLKTGQPGAWDSWVDIESWARYFIHAEIMKSVDAYRFSTYFYTEGEGHTIKFGPPWDYDFSSGNTGWVVDQTGQVKQPHSWQYMYALTIATDSYGNVLSAPQLQHTPCAADWFKRMLDVPAFKNKVSEVYHSMRQTVLSDPSVNTLMEAMKDELKKPKTRNFATYPTLDRVDYWPHFPYPIEKTYDGKFMQFQDYMLARLKWLDENIYGYIPHDFLGEGSTCDAGAPIPDCLFNFVHLNEKYPEFPQFAKCNSNDFAGLLWVRGNWQSEPKMFYNTSHPTTDGTDCSVVEYLHWEAGAGLGDYDCPIPGGPDGILPPYYDPSTPMKCPLAKCGKDDPLMTPACQGTFDYVKQNWENPKYKDNGVDCTDPASLSCDCSIQSYLHDVEKIPWCPAVRGSLTPLFCVNNQCQKEDGTNSPTTAMLPTLPPSQETLPPTPPPTNPIEPTPPLNPTLVNPTIAPTVVPNPTQATTCGSAKMTTEKCQAVNPKFVPVESTTPCTSCDESDCCRLPTCHDRMKDWSMDYEDIVSLDEICSVEFGNQTNPKRYAGGSVQCEECSYEECCFAKSCSTHFTGDCGDGRVPAFKEMDIEQGCDDCDAAQCCRQAAVAPTLSPVIPTTDDSGGVGTGAVIAILFVVAIIGAGLFMWKTRRDKQMKMHEFSLEEGAATYSPPVATDGPGSINV